MENGQSRPPTLYSLAFLDRLDKNGDVAVNTVGNGCKDERTPAAARDAKNSRADTLSGRDDPNFVSQASDSGREHESDEEEEEGESLADVVRERRDAPETLQIEVSCPGAALKKTPSRDHLSNEDDSRRRHYTSDNASPAGNLSERRDHYDSGVPNKTANGGNSINEDHTSVEASAGSARGGSACGDSLPEDREEETCGEISSNEVNNGRLHGEGTVHRFSSSRKNDTKNMDKNRISKIISKSVSFLPLQRATSKQKLPEAHTNGKAAPLPFNGTIPANGSEDTLHENHDPRKFPKKIKPRLHLQMPSLPKRLQGRRRAVNSPPVTSQSRTNEISENGFVPKKITRRLTFPFTNAARRRSDNTPASAPAVTGGGAQDQGESSAGKPGCCGPCGVRFPCAERVKRILGRDAGSIEGKEIRNTIVVGLAFQLFYTAHFAIQNLQSSLHEEEYLGVSALSCLYATSIFSSIFAPTIIGLLGTKRSLVLAWFCHILYTLAQFYPSWETLVPASIVLGAMTGPTWTAQGLYVTACAYSFSKRSPHSPYTILSRFNGLFFTLYETRQILGNLLSSVVLKDGVANKSSEVIFKFCGTKDCPAAENVTDIEEPDAWVIDVMLGIYMALQILGLFLTVFLVTPLARSEWSARAPVRETLTSWFKTLVGTEMLFLVPFMVFQAVEQGILLSEYTKSYISCPIGIHMVGFVMATHGATSAVFVFIFSRLARHTGRFPLFVFAAVISLVLLVVLFDWSPDSSQEALIFSFPVVWGIGEGIWQTQTNSMIAVVFTDRKEAAFANYQTWRAVGFTFVFSFHSVLCVSTKIAIALGFLLVGMILYTGVEVRLRRKERVREPKPLDVTTVVEHQPSTTNTTTASAAAAAATTTVAASPGEPSLVSALVAGSGAGGVPKNGGQRHFSLPPPHRSPLHAPLQSDLHAPDTVCGGGSNAEEDSAENGDVARRAGFATFAYDDDVETGGHLTLDGAYLSSDESPQLDNDMRVRYGVLLGGHPADENRRQKLTNDHPQHSADETQNQIQNSWGAEIDEVGDWNSGSFEAANYRPARQHSKHQDHFLDEGELKVLRTKNDVFVY